MPRDLGELQEVVSDFVDSLDENGVRRVVRGCQAQRQAVYKNGGSNLESQLKKYRRKMIEE